MKQLIKEKNIRYCAIPLSRLMKKKKKTNNNIESKNL